MNLSHLFESAFDDQNNLGTRNRESYPNTILASHERRKWPSGGDEGRERGAQQQYDVTSFSPNIFAISRIILQIVNARGRVTTVRKACAPGTLLTCLFGLFLLEASLANILFEAIPAETVYPSSRSTARRMAAVRRAPASSARSNAFLGSTRCPAVPCRASSEQCARRHREAKRRMGRIHDRRRQTALTSLSSKKNKTTQQKNSEYLQIRLRSVCYIASPPTIRLCTYFSDLLGYVEVGLIDRCPLHSAAMRLTS